MEQTNFRIITKNNEERWIGHECHSVYDNTGNNLGQRGSNRDITESKQAEEIIATQNRRLANILKGTNVGTWEWNIQTGEVFFNERWAEIIGYQLEEISPVSIETWKKFSHPDDLIVSDELLEKHFNNELSYYIWETRMKHKNGDWIWVLDSGRVNQWDDEGKPLLMSGTHQDITERKQMEEALKKSEDDFRNLFDQSPAGSVLVNFERHFVKCNTAFCVFLGYTEDELIGKDVTDFTYHKDINIGMLEMKQILKGKLKSVIVEKRYVHKDGSILWGEVNMSLIRDANNNPVYFLPIIQNITKRKQAEEELIAAKKLTEESNKELENLNAQKNKFFSIIAHDLKSPFNSILGFSNLLVEQIKEKNYDGIEKYAGIIEQSSNRAMDLLMNLMEGSRSQTGRMEFNAEHFEMISLIKNVALLFDDIAGQKKISINTNKLPSQAPIFADKAMINTILRNLISNAIKFTHTGGEIIILTNENQKELTVSVSDNGVGIPKAYIKKIFRIDEDYSTSGTNKEKGTGLGLILCKEFVEKHEGNIWAESEEGKGSTFYFTLPKEAETKEENDVEKIIPEEDEYNHINQEVSGLKILIADDDDTSQQLISIMVEMFSKELLHAQNGIEAVDACHLNPDIDLILMDMKMPAMGGLESTRQIRKFNKEVIIIAQTAFGLPSDRGKAIESGCNDYISKPINKTELLALIQKHFKK